jgi:hypothetical protein
MSGVTVKMITGTDDGLFSAEFSWFSLLRSSVHLETEISLHIYHILGSNERDDYLAGLGWRSHKNTEENVRKNVYFD